MTAPLLLRLSITVASAVLPASQGVLAPIDWQIHDTEHFEIAYPKTLDVDLDRVGRAVELAYQEVSADLGHDLPFTPMVVLFAERGERDRITASGRLLPAREHILLTLDMRDELFDRDFVHELTHTFQFDILPRSVVNDLPLWFTEGLAEHERGVWEPRDLLVLSEMVQTKAVPRISPLTPLSLPENPALNRSLGHATFDFIVSRWGKQGMRDFVFSLREDPVTLQEIYATAFGLSPDDFDRSFEKYLTERFR